MHDSFFVRSAQAVCHLNPVVHCFPERQRPPIQPLAETLPFEQFRNQEVGTVLVANIEDREKIVMVQGTENSRFLLKALQTFGIGGKGRGKDLDRNTSLEAGVTRAVYLAHAAGAERRLNFIRAEFRARGEGHPFVPL